MDLNNQSSLEYRPEQVQPAEIIYGMQAESAARLAYQERGSYAEMLSRMFAEAEAAPDRYDWNPKDDQAVEQSVGKRDSQAFREVMKSMYKRLKESDTINQFRYHGGHLESEQDVAAVFAAYDRALDKSLEKSDLSDRQDSRLRFAAKSELDWGLRDLITHHVLSESEDRTFEPKDFLLMLNPKIRKVDYMDSKEILGVLRRSASMASKDRLKADLAALRRSERADAQAALEAFEG